MLNFKFAIFISIMKKTTQSFYAFLAMISLLFSCTGQKQDYQQPVLGSRSVAVLEKPGLRFKDLNKNGALYKYEDWRLTAEERSLDLLSKMSLEEKAGFMLTNTLNPVGKVKAEASGGKLSPGDFDEGGTQEPFAGRIGVPAGNRVSQGGDRGGALSMTGDWIHAIFHTCIRQCC